MCQRHISNVDLDLWVVASRLWGYYDLKQVSAGFSLRFSVIGLPWVLVRGTYFVSCVVFVTGHSKNA